MTSGAACSEVTAIRITEVDDLAGCTAVVNLLGAIWDLPAGVQFAPPQLLLAMAHAGNYIAAGYDADRMVAASMAFLGLEGPRPILHSHVTGVVPDLQGRAIGFALKHHQRDWCLARGIEAVEWTFDPLVRRNGYFNLEKLGAAVTDYYANYYGTMSDGINQGDDTDRCLVRWSLTSERDGRTTTTADLVQRGATVMLDPDDSGVVTVRNPPPDHSRVLLVPVPADIVALRNADPDAAHAWRLAVRDTMGAAIQRGYHATGMTSDGAYVLRFHAPAEDG